MERRARGTVCVEEETIVGGRVVVGHGVVCAVCHAVLQDAELTDGDVCSNCEEKMMNAILETRNRQRKENPKLRREKLRM